MLRKLSAVGLVAGLGVANGALADHGARSEYVYAPILEVAPIVREVTVTRPRQECWLETSVVPSDQPRRGQVGAVLAGGLIGGVIGHQIGHGSRNDAMTVLGTLVGSAVGSEAARNRDRYASHTGYGQEVTTERCEMVPEAYVEERIDGYRVTYEHFGRRYMTVMPEPPRGDRIRLRVTVESAGY